VALTILYVCTGNVCRSPMAEYLLRQRSTGRRLHVASAGVAALVGEPVDTGSATVLASFGIDSSTHRARQFEPWMATDADLVLTAEVAHRDAVMAEVPAALRRTFTIKEFARLVRHVGTAEPRELIDRSAQIRGMYGAVPLELDDVPDPFRAGVSRAQLTFAQIAAALDPMISAFGLAASAPQRRVRPLPRPRRPLPNGTPA
jgi:low molecular weight protein-tyrosine phosphatase